MEKDTALIIFQKNLVKGKVKTRLAKSIGDEKALEVFKALIAKTYDQIPTEYLDVKVFFGQKINPFDHPLSQKADFYVQSGDDLGERMSNAFETVFKEGYKKILIIGTDCPFITPEIYKEAIAALDNHTFVIGPANDSGYYLLGSTVNPKPIMQDITWSTSTVLQDTTEKIEAQEESYNLLEELTDIDDAEDFKQFEEEFERTA